MKQAIESIQRLIKDTDLILTVESDTFCYLDSVSQVFALNIHSVCGTPEEVLSDLRRGLTDCAGNCENDNCKIGK